MRVGDKAFRGEAGTVQVAARDAGPSDIQLAGDPAGNQAHPRVEHVRPRPVDRGTDVRGRSRDVADRGVDGALGGAVHVGGVDAVGAGECGPQLGGDRLAADREQAGAMRGGGIEQALAQQLRHQQRHAVDSVDVVATHVLDDAGRIRGEVRAEHVQRVPGQHRQQRVDCRVECQRIRQQDPPPTVVRRSERPSALCRQQIDDATVRYDDTLRDTRRSGGVDDVRGVVRARSAGPLAHRQRTGRQGGVDRGDRALVEHQDRAASASMCAIRSAG